MVASIRLQPVGDEREILRDLIAELAAEHGTMPFEPHLTVCTIANPAAELMQAAADYITACRALPLHPGLFRKQRQGPARRDVVRGRLHQFRGGICYRADRQVRFERHRTVFGCQLGDQIAQDLALVSDRLQPG